MVKRLTHCCTCAPGTVSEAEQTVVFASWWDYLQTLCKVTKGSLKLHNLKYQVFLVLEISCICKLERLQNLSLRYSTSAQCVARTPCLTAPPPASC